MKVHTSVSDTALWYLIPFLFFLSPLTFHLTPAFAASGDPVTIKADHVEYFDTAGKVEARGNVVATHLETTLTCDQATIYMETKDAYLRGRVRLIQPSGLLKAQEAIYNFETRKGTLLQAEGETDPWRTKGTHAHKVAGSAFLYRHGYITSCDFEEPHTRLQAKEVQIFLDDKVVLKNAVMYIGNAPVFFLPSYTHPLDDKRPRVAILPGKSKLWGLFVLTTWRLYLHENLQGRVHIDYRERQDLASGVDLKYQLPEGGDGIFRSYYTNERDIQRRHLWSRYFNAKKNRQLTTERERFRVQLRHRWELDEKTRVAAEYNVVKDSAIIKDFFLGESQKESSTPPTFIELTHLSTWYGLTFLMNKRVNQFGSLTQQWPSVTFDIRPFRIPFLPTLGSLGRLEEEPKIPKVGDLSEEAYRRKIEAASTTGWYYRSNYDYVHSNISFAHSGTADSLLRFNTLQEISYPMRLFRRFNFRPFGNFRETASSRAVVKRKPQFRQAAATGFDLSTKFFRTFPMNSDLLGIQIHNLRHIVTPSLIYSYQAKPNLSAESMFRGDGLAKGNSLSFGMEHKLQTKRLEENGQETVDLLRFNSSESYDLEGPNGRGGRWGNSVGADLEAKPYRWLYIESDMGVNPFLRKVTAINADLVAAPLPGQHRSVGIGSENRIGEYVDAKSGQLAELPWAVGLGWRYQRKTSAQLTLETEFNIGKKWRIGVYQGFDVKRFITETSDRGNRIVKKIYDVPEVEYRIRRDLHEWTVELVYDQVRSQGSAIFLLFRLKAFPEMPFDFERHYHQPKAGKNFAKAGEIRDLPTNISP